MLKKITNLSGEDLLAHRASLIADCSVHVCKVQTRRKFRKLSHNQPERKALYKDGTYNVDSELSVAIESGSSPLRLFEERSLQKQDDNSDISEHNDT